MTYSEKLSQSEHRAHLQNVATKIERGMREIRSQSDSSPTARRRWGWELLQNARDARHPEDVQVEILYNHENSLLVFRHNGRPFSADNIRFLIEQISTKDRTKDENGVRKETGRFGTGFLSTHMLAETVTVKGIAKESNLGFKRFRFVLDRSGQDIDAIIAAAEKAKNAISGLDNLPDLNDYNPSSFNTEFEFNLVDSLSHKAAIEGLEDLENCLAFTLVCVPEIKKVTLHPKNIAYHRNHDGPLSDASVTLSQVTMSSNPTNVVGYATFVSVCKGLTRVSVPVLYSATTITIAKIPDSSPRLYCDFPLVGTEVFYLPYVVNNPHFEPTDSRDGIYLNDSQRTVQVTKINQEIVRESVECFRELIRFALANNWGNLHLLANIRQMSRSTDWVSQDWHKKNIVEQVRALVANEAIVTVASGTVKKAMLKSDGTPDVWFPTARNPAARKALWELAQRWFPHSTPVEDHLELWSDVIWDGCGKLSAEQLCKFIEQMTSKQSLESQLQQVQCDSWLNSFYQMLEDDDGPSISAKYAIFPNQKGAFCKLSSLSRDAGNIEEELKTILTLFGRDVRAELGDRELQIPIAYERSIDRSWVVKEINAFAWDKLNNREVAKVFRPALIALLSWMRSNPTKAQEAFPVLYNQKYLLYDEETVEKNMDKAEQLDKLLADSGVADISELRSLINQKADLARRPLSEQILASLGITSLEEWEAALKDRDLASIFAHESTPSAAMFAYVQNLIRAAKSNILNHLKSLPNYDLTDCEETAPTVLGGILKDGKEVQIVVRPAYNREVIIYYSAERDVLDFLGDSELWVDTGTTQFQVTLGYLLKKTQIHKFPV